MNLKENIRDGTKLRDGTNLSTRTKHPIPNAVSPRRFHCIPGSYCSFGRNFGGYLTEYLFC